jgi:hypothetical protein
MSGKERPLIQSRSLEGLRADDLGRSWLSKMMEALGANTLNRLQFGNEETKDVIFDVEDPIVSTVEELDKLFIAPHAATDPELARRGYALLSVLLMGAVGTGQVQKDSYRDEVLREIAARGGKAPRAKVQKWTTEALPIAMAYVASHPNYTQADLIRKISQKVASAPGERAIRNWISDLQGKCEFPSPKKQLEVKRASMHRI